jgi:hypothetical protein
LTVFGVVTHIGDLLRSGNTDYIPVATNLGVYLALLTSLELVHMLLSRARGKASVQNGLEHQAPATPSALSEEVKALADDPSNKIQAIALHREQTGVGVAEAKDAVEAYMDGRG